MNRKCGHYSPRRGDARLLRHCDGSKKKAVKGHLILNQELQSSMSWGKKTAIHLTGLVERLGRGALRLSFGQPRRLSLNGSVALQTYPKFGESGAHGLIARDSRAIQTLDQPFQPHVNFHSSI
jgi:hypothetical protein